MADHWDSGFMVRTPSWHRKENAVLATSPKTWEAARAEAGLTWDVESEPVYDVDDSGLTVPIPGWQKIVRDDKDELGERVLAIQQQSYAMITNGEFGSVVDAVVGRQAEEDPVTFEALFALYGGRMIVALVYFDTPLAMSDIDGSHTYTYLGMMSRHDGSGGLRGLPTNVRIQCANTMNQAEVSDGRQFGFSIRHTASWDERVKEVSAKVQAARGDTKEWVEFAHQLAAWKVKPRQRDTFLKRFLPISDADSERTSNNRIGDRSAIRGILESPTTRDIADNGYGLLMAATEWSDHVRTHQSVDSFVSRQLLRKEDNKALAARILRNMAGIKS